MKIAIAADHAGFEQKQRIVSRLKELHHEILDLGCHSTEACDYPPLAQQVAEAVVTGIAEGGVLICGTGVGMSIAANKVPGVRASLCVTEIQAHDTKTHNDSNVLVLAARVNSTEANLKLAEVWVSTKFSGVDRHARRVAEIADIEKKYMKS